MRRILLLPVLLACAACTSGCSLFSPKADPAASDGSRDVFVGVVESVNPEQKFVLVRTDMRLMVAPGTKLETRSQAGAQASLTVTPERKMNFLSADITEGSPAAGDIVIMPAGAAVPTPSLQAPGPMPAMPGMQAPEMRVPTP
jgi:hypothetical protein